MGFVYFMQEGTEAIKIGMTRQNYINREEQLQRGNPRPINCIGVIQSDSPLLLEREMHQQFYEQKIRGEWFDIGWGDAAEVIQEHGGKITDPRGFSDKRPTQSYGPQAGSYGHLLEPS